MRKLNLSDVFKMGRIIKAANIKTALVNIFKNVDDKDAGISEDDSEEMKEQKLEKLRESVGLEAVMTVFEACCTEQLENMIYDFLGGVTEKETEKIATQSLGTTIEDIKTIVKENNVADFFKDAGRLIQ